METANLIGKLLDAAGYGHDIQDIAGGYLVGVRDNCGPLGYITVGDTVRYSSEGLRRLLNSGEICPDPVR